MGFEEVTEEREKKSAEKEDEEIDEWMKMSNDLHWDLRQPYKQFFLNGCCVTKY